MKRVAIIMGVMLTTFCSCTVKEDRGNCPCRLMIKADSTTSISAWYGSHRLFEGLMGGVADRPVPRGTVEIVANEGDFTVPEGRQMDRLYAQLLEVDTHGETAGVSVRLNKQFATVFLAFKDEENGRIGDDLQVTGSVCGADRRTLEPVEGLFRCIPDGSERGYRFRLPRQKDESLKVLLSRDGKPTDTIDLGHLITRAGFNWKAESLGDVSILCDLSARTFTITVMEWEGPVRFEITL
ncbi:MAG: hypothetical protein IJQ35_00855 [Bacteroidales bacterium]|nr:hypothetical protein [Bacteroidales bacterium]